MTEKELLIREQTETSLKHWREKEKMALDLLRIVGELRFDKSIELILFRYDIYDVRPSQLIHNHEVSTNYTDQKLTIAVTLPIARAVAKLPDLKPARIDIGKLAVEYLEQASENQTIDDFVSGRLGELNKENDSELKPKDVILYGFGRIGRLVARRIIETTGRGEQLRLKAIVIRPKLKDLLEETTKRAALLRDDSVHGGFHGRVSVAEGGKELNINGNRVQMIYAGEPEEIDYTEYGIKDAIVIDNTGVFRNKTALNRHLRPGVNQVMLTAPGDGIPNIVYGANQLNFDLEKENLFCAASCTTNAIVPVIKVIDEAFGIERGHIETVPAYTNDQNLLDNFHKKPRRGRGAPINMVLTSTGAAKAVAKVLPHLAGTLTGNAVRVPTPNVSLAILNLSIKSEVAIDTVNELLRQATLEGDFVEQIQYSTSTEFVSSHAVGTTACTVFDAPSTIVSNDGKNLTLYAWYDNEYGYTCQVVRLAKYAAKVRRQVYY